MCSTPTEPKPTGPPCTPHPRHNPKLTNISPTCTIVDYATTLLTSPYQQPIHEANRQEHNPKATIQPLNHPILPQTHSTFHSKHTPAHTKVALCSSADTGVGPSIASSNHECIPIIADFHQQPTKKATPTTIPIVPLIPNRLKLDPILPSKHQY